MYLATNTVLTIGSSTQNATYGVLVDSVQVLYLGPTVAPQTALSLSSCSATGDPHYASFDGIKFDYQGIGVYYLLKTSSLIVESREQPCIPNKITPVCNNALSVSYGASKVSAVLNNDGTITVYDLTGSVGLNSDDLGTVVSANLVKLIV